MNETRTEHDNLTEEKFFNIYLSLLLLLLLVVRLLVEAHSTQLGRDAPAI